MGVHDQVRRHPRVLVEGHVLLGDDQAHNALLTVPGAELVADLGHPRLPLYHLDQVGLLVGRGQNDSVHVGGQGPLVGLGLLSVLEGDVVLHVLAHHGPRLLRDDGAVLVDEDVAVLQLLAHVGEPVRPQRLELLEPERVDPTHLVGLDLGRLLYLVHCIRVLIPLQRGHIAPEDAGPSEAAVETGPVQNDGVLDVIAGVAHDGDGGVLPRGQLLEVDHLERPRLDQGPLGVVHE
mmetsp:Transcript_11995/g.20251  ORF Transcript_11995/g.20251 Transcript_11995/m.20251 type:complete len:235 (-) Transcript_11995:536-1240(-)